MLDRFLSVKSTEGKIISKTLGEKMGFTINCIEISLPEEENILKESSHLYKNLYTEKT